MSSFNWLGILFALSAGAALGLFYFGGLWLTVQRLTDSRRPAVWLLVSFLLRTGLLLVVLYFVMGGQLERLAAAMFGFLISRQVLIGRLKPRPARPFLERE
jgi:F1F0 ATPase subunit 2